VELDRASRVVELAVCVLWIAALVVRMRSIQVALSAETFVERLEAALRLIQIGTWTLVALSIPLWMEAKWQPYAHALFVPSFVAAGFVTSLRGAMKRRCEPKRQVTGPA
jgi:hypothetical protein